MQYATRADIDKIYGSEFVTDLLDEGVDVDIAFADALGRASAEIDVHLSARYSLPLASAPKALVMPCINIGIYHVALSHSHLTENMRERYKDAIDMLKRIADGKAGLGTDEPSVSDEPGASDGGAFFSANERKFSRKTLL